MGCRRLGEGEAERRLGDEGGMDGGDEQMVALPSVYVF